MIRRTLVGGLGVLFWLVAWSAVLSGQVIIRERIPIDPKAAPQAQPAAAAGATLRFEFRYAGPTREPDLNFIRVRNIVCGVDQTGSLNSSISVPAQSGIWSFFARVHTPSASGIYAVTSVYLNSDLIQRDSALISCASTCQINLSSGVTLSNTFNFSANSYVFYTEQASLGAQASGQVHCTNELWHPGLPVTLSIVSGADRGQFANAQGDTLGDVVTVPGRDVGTITFLANGVEPDTISDFVTIQASSFGITRTATIEVLRVSPSPIWLGLRAQGDVSYGAEMYLEAQALDMFQSEVGAGSGVTYTFEIIEGSQWGSLFRLAAEGNKIENVVPTNGFFSKGYAFVGFRARNQEPDGPKRVTVEVRASDASIRDGTYSFYVLPSPLAISVVPPEVGYGEQATILVQKKNPDGSVSPWPADAGLYFEIIKGVGAGYLFHEDTSSRNDWYDGRSSTVQFAALEESPQLDTAEVRFYVQVYDEGSSLPPVIVAADSSVPRPKMSTLSSSGALAWGLVPPNPALRRTALANLLVLKLNVAVNLSLDRETLFPTLTSTPTANEGKSNEVTMMVNVTQDGIPLSRQQIEIKTRPILPSGGHVDHPEFPQNQLGEFLWIGKRGNPLVVSTNDQGFVEGLTYKTGEFSILTEFSAKHIGSSAEEKMEKQVSIYPLIRLQGGHYELKPIVSDEQKKHPSPYWIVEGLDQSLDSISAQYNRLFPNDSKLVITDVGLEHGGKYEITGNWTHSSHKYHRLGMDVDLRSTNVQDDDFEDLNDNGIFDDDERLTLDHNENQKLDLNRTELRRILDDWVPRPAFEPTKKDENGNIIVFEHFHLYFWN